MPRFRSPDFLVNDDDYPNSGTWQFHCKASADAQGNFWTVWSDGRNGDGDIFLARLDSDGNPLSSNIRVNDDRGMIVQWWTAVASNGNGAVVVWYESTAPIGMSTGRGNIYYQRFDAAGNKIDSNVQVNDTPDMAYGDYKCRVDVAMNYAGRFVVTWTDCRAMQTNGLDIYAQIFDENGNAIGSNLRVNDDLTAYYQYGSACDIDIAGRFIIVWRDTRYAPMRCSIYAQGFNADGTPIGSNFRINREEAYYSEVCINEPYTAVVVWYGKHSDPEQFDILAQKFDLGGNPLSNIIQVTETAGLNYYPDIDANSNGSLAITWWGYATPFFNVYSQWYQADLAPIGANFQVNDISWSMLADVIPSIAFSSSNDRILYA